MAFIEIESRSITLPFLLVGFKTYIRATGRGAVELAEVAEKVMQETGVCVVVSPQYTDIAPIAMATEVPILAQHVDPIEPGNHTGHVLPEALRYAGATGTMLNHSERRLGNADLTPTLDGARRAGLVTLVCAEGLEESRKIAGLGPGIILSETPELIGTGRAISTTDPSVVSGTVEAVKATNPDVVVICGAGITNGDDVMAAVRLGVVGVGAASAIIKAEEPYSIMHELAGALADSYRGDKGPVRA
ncbi:MAG: triose-phosphate isomerase [Theionarchaea archaeon]|nr:triose-phosphate isomerase [Theionarchaea archaeon]